MEIMKLLMNQISNLGQSYFKFVADNFIVTEILVNRFVIKEKKLQINLKSP